ncbi:hypothetical protein SCALM49S_07529 [Streptomyces californicus]
MAAHVHLDDRGRTRRSAQTADADRRQGAGEGRPERSDLGGDLLEAPRPGNPSLSNRRTPAGPPEKGLGERVDDTTLRGDRAAGRGPGPRRGTGPTGPRSRRTPGRRGAAGRRASCARPAGTPSARPRDGGSRGPATGSAARCDRSRDYRRRTARRTRKRRDRGREAWGKRNARGTSGVAEREPLPRRAEAYRGTGGEGLAVPRHRDRGQHAMTGPNRPTTSARARTTGHVSPLRRGRKGCRGRKGRRASEKASAER